MATQSSRRFGTMHDVSGSRRRAAASTALAFGAAALALTAGLVLLIVLFGAVLTRYGFGALLLVTAVGLLLVGWLVDRRRKRGGRLPPA